MQNPPIPFYQNPGFVRPIQQPPPYYYNVMPFDASVISRLESKIDNQNREILQLRNRVNGMTRNMFIMRKELNDYKRKIDIAHVPYYNNEYQTKRQKTKPDIVPISDLKTVKHRHEKTENGQANKIPTINKAENAPMILRFGPFGGGNIPDFLKSIFENDGEKKEEDEKLPERKIKEDGEEIDTTIKSIDDLIALGEKLKDDEKEYCIDKLALIKLVSPLKKLKSMIGMEKIKKSIIEMIMYYLQKLDGGKELLHTVIEGPPGVGKTEVGKIIAEIYASLGITKNDKFKIARRSDLIGEYLGQTAVKTQKMIDNANGGVLFIDEAYSLGNQEKRDIYSKECIDTINLNLSENKHFICIIAGYPDELDSSFFSYNPGLRRRFPFTYKIDDYTHTELKDIFIKKVKDIEWDVDDDEQLHRFFKDNKKNLPHFGGDIENLVTACKFSHSNRTFGKRRKGLNRFSQQDIIDGFGRLSEHKKKEDNRYLVMFS